MDLPVCTACLAHLGFADWLHSGLVSFILTRGISEMDLVPAEWVVHPVPINTVLGTL